ncbi:MAG: hypothetical protein JXQ29_18445 [Planctomycetes bacterium]|nr:hypothetical protein [Planctomycetota bacterium]
MTWRQVALVCLGGLILSSWGCSSRRTFTVHSWPAGARIFVEHDECGQTVGKVTVDFRVQPYYTIWVQKAGMQPAGKLVDIRSPEVVSFVLEQAPDTGALKEIRSSLRAIERKLEK